MKDNFSTIVKLAKAILGIPSSQIERERVLSIVGILPSLSRCRFGSKNLDLLVLLIKNWLDHPIVGFEVKRGSLEGMDEFGEAKEEILDLLDAEFPNEI
jgi:hypothetical protein